VVFCGFFTFAGPLSIMDLALPPRHGSDLRVAYQVGDGNSQWILDVFHT